MGEIFLLTGNGAMRMDEPLIYTPGNGLYQVIKRQEAIELAKKWMVTADVSEEPPHWVVAAIQEAAWIGKEK